MLNIDFESLSREFLRALRGRRSQVAFSRRLRYRSNVAYLWEAGRNYPTAAVSLEAVERTGGNVRAAIAGFYRSTPSFLTRFDPSAAASVAEFLADLRGQTPIGLIAKRAGRSRFAVSRWLRGQTEPRLPDFFRLVEATSLRLLDFLDQLVDVSKLPSVADAWTRLVSARQLLTQTPWATAVLLVLETDGYRSLDEHKPGWIAARLGLELEVETECLERLAESGQIELRERLWQPGEVQSIDTRSRPEVGRQLKSWWTRLGIARLEAGCDGVFSYNVFTVSNADYERLCEMQRSYYRALRAAISESAPAERVVVTNLAMFPLEGTAALL